MLRFQFFVMSCPCTVPQMATGRDDVRYVTACSDTVQQLHMFRGICQPVFIFIMQGKLKVGVRMYLKLQLKYQCDIYSTYCVYKYIIPVYVIDSAQTCCTLLRFVKTFHRTDKQKQLRCSTTNSFSNNHD